MVKLSIRARRAPETIMLELCRFSGFLAAHGFWSIRGGGPLIPIVALELPDGSRQMRGMAVEDLRQAVEMGQAHLESQPDGARIAALIYDGYVTIEGEQRIDALLLDAREYAGEGRLKLAVPYRPAEHPDGLAVHRPKFLDLRASAETSPADAGRAFFQGVDLHAEAAPLWNRHLDESL